MLVDTGCDRTMVSAKLVKTSRVDKGCKVPVLCAHGDTVFYPTARVKLQTGSWECESGDCCIQPTSGCPARTRCL